MILDVAHGHLFEEYVVSEKMAQLVGHYIPNDEAHILSSFVSQCSLPTTL